MTTLTIEDVKNKIRAVENFPKEGILFRDITTALKDAEVMRNMVDFLYEKYKDKNIDYVAGMESRGFIVGMPLAYKLGVGFVPVRKPNKLPAATFKQSYELEYGVDTIEMHQDAVEEGKNVLIVDDLLATGGTADAAVKLVSKLANVKGIAFVIELEDLGGRAKLPQDIKVVSLTKY